MKKNIIVQIEDVEKCDVCGVSTVVHFIPIIVNTPEIIKQKFLLCYNCFGKMLFNYIHDE